LLPCNSFLLFIEVLAVMSEYVIPQQWQPKKEDVCSSTAAIQIYTEEIPNKEKKCFKVSVGHEE
jgi:hypothetical protein